MPLDAEVESDPTLLTLVLIPDEAEVEREVTPLLVEDSPVDSDVTPLWAVLIPLDVEVESDPT